MAIEGATSEGALYALVLMVLERNLTVRRPYAKVTLRGRDRRFGCVVIKVHLALAMHSIPSDIRPATTLLRPSSAACSLCRTRLVGLLHRKKMVYV